MPDLILKSTGERRFVPPERVQSALEGGRYALPDDAADQSVPVEVRPGLVGETTMGNLPTAEAGGATIEGESSFRGRERSTRIDREHGGAGGQLLTGVESFVDEALVGIPSMVGELVGGDAYSERRLERAEANPITATASGIGGMVAPALLSGGSGTAARVAAKTPLGWAANVSSQLAGGGVTKLGKAGRVLAGGALEGAVAGVGAGIQQAVDSDDPLTIELIASGIGHNLISGAGVGAAAAGGAKLIEKGLHSAKGALDRVSDLAAKRANVGDDLARMERPQLKAAEDAEIEALAAAQVGQRAEAAGGITRYRDAVREANPWLVIDEGADAKLLVTTNNRIRSALDDPRAIEATPQAVLKPLRVQEGVLERTLASEAELAAKFAATNQKLVDNLTEQLAKLEDGASVTIAGRAARRYGSYADVKVGRGAKASATLTREEAETFLGALQRGEVEGARQASLRKMRGLLDENRALQAKIEGAALPRSQLTSDRLKAIREAREVLAEGGKKSIAEQMLSGSVYGVAAGAVGGIPGVGDYLAPFAGAAAAGYVGKNVFGRMAQGVANATSRTSKVVGAFLGAAKRVTRPAPVLATKVLSESRFAEESKTEKARSEKPTTLSEAYKRRSHEIRSQVLTGPDGKTVMRQDARVRMGAKLDPIRTSAPVLADRLETLAAKRIEFLASKLPKLPDIAAMRLGGGDWPVSDMEMRTFARYVAAVEDPGAIEERLVDGTITPEDADVMREVYPARLAEITQQVIVGMAEFRETLPYHRRLSLSILTGIPVDPALDPGVLSVLQAQYELEEGTEGGTQAPVAQAQFGSVTKEKATPAQERQGASP